jgi:Homeodomain-like domain
MILVVHRSSHRRRRRRRPTNNFTLSSFLSHLYFHYSKPLSIWMPYQYLDPAFKQVVVLLSAHLSQSKIADYLGVDRSTVWRIVKLFNEYGIWAMEGRSGRPPLLGDAETLVSFWLFFVVNCMYVYADLCLVHRKDHQTLPRYHTRRGARACMGEVRPDRFKIDDLPYFEESRV